MYTNMYIIWSTHLAYYGIHTDTYVYIHVYIHTCFYTYAYACIYTSHVSYPYTLWTYWKKWMTHICREGYIYVSNHFFIAYVYNIHVYIPFCGKCWYHSDVVHCASRVKHLCIHTNVCMYMYIRMWGVQYIRMCACTCIYKDSSGNSAGVEWLIRYSDECTSNSVPQYTVAPIDAYIKIQREQVLHV